MLQIKMIATIPIPNGYGCNDKISGFTTLNFLANDYSRQAKLFTEISQVSTFLWHYSNTAGHNDVYKTAQDIQKYLSLLGIEYTCTNDSVYGIVTSYFRIVIENK